MMTFIRNHRASQTKMEAVALGVIYMACSCSCLALANEVYIEYKTYEAMKALVPELPEARLAGGLAPAGYELWKRGQARIPITGNFLTADFRQTGEKDAAILFEEHKDNNVTAYVLIARQTRNGWSRLFLQRLNEPGGIRWDEKKNAIEIDTAERVRITSPASMQWAYGHPPTATYGYNIDLRSPAYIRWDAGSKQFEYVTPVSARFQPWMVKANLDAYMRDFALDQFTGVHIKLTYIGPQGEPYPGLILFAPGYVPNLEFFKKYRRPRIHYGNDDANIFTRVVLAPKYLREAVSRIWHLENLDAILRRTGQESSTVFSFSILYIDSDPHFCELLLTWEETKSLLLSMVRLIETENFPTYPILKDYMTLFGP